MSANPTRGTSPAFMLYALDLMTRRDYRLMSLAERGLLLSMWLECWANVDVPASPGDLSALLGKDVTGALTPRVLAFFQSAGDSLRSPDLEEYRQRVLQRRNVFREAGAKGGKKRAENERRTREASSHPSSLPSQTGQASLKPAEPEPELEPDPELDPDIGSVDRRPVKVDEWLEGYKKGEAEHGVH